MAGVGPTSFLARAEPAESHHGHHIVPVLLHRGVLGELDTGLFTLCLLLCFCTIRLALIATYNTSMRVSSAASKTQIFQVMIAKNSRVILPVYLITVLSHSRSRYKTLHVGVRVEVEVAEVGVACTISLD